MIEIEIGNNLLQATSTNVLYLFIFLFSLRILPLIQRCIGMYLATTSKEKRDAILPGKYDIN